MTEAAIRSATEAVVMLLVARDYQALERLTAGDRLPAAQMHSAIDDYGLDLIPIPHEGWSEPDVLAEETSRSSTSEFDELDPPVATDTEAETAPDRLDAWERLLTQAAGQGDLTDGEVTRLVALLPPDDSDCFGLAWTLVHLIEAAPSSCTERSVARCRGPRVSSRSLGRRTPAASVVGSRLSTRLFRRVAS